MKDCRAVQRSALCRSRRELSNAFFLAKFGFVTAENEPSKVCRTGVLLANYGVPNEGVALREGRGRQQDPVGQVAAFDLVRMDSHIGQACYDKAKVDSFSKICTISKFQLANLVDLRKCSKTRI